MQSSTLKLNRFRWAKCQIDALESCLDYRTLEGALTSLPKTLDETYHRILQAIPSEHKRYATILLQLITFSERPVTIEEAVDAIAVRTDEQPYFCPKYRMPDPQEISRYCSSLVTVVSVKKNSHNESENRVELQLAHFSVKEYLLSERLDGDIARDFQECYAGAAICRSMSCLSTTILRESFAKGYNAILSLCKIFSKILNDQRGKGEGYG